MSITSELRLYYVGQNKFNYNTSITPGSIFVISWVSNYEIYLNDENIISLNNQKQQTIRGIDALTYSTINSEDSGSNGENSDENSDSDDEDSVEERRRLT